jgi:hypothetical protein
LPDTQGDPLSIGHRRTKLVFSTFEELAGDGHKEIRPGDITTRLRERNLPLSYWEVRGELSNLEAEGLIEVDAETGAWRLIAKAVRKAG